MQRNLNQDVETHLQSQDIDFRFSKYYLRPNLETLDSRPGQNNVKALKGYKKFIKMPQQNVREQWNTTITMEQQKYQNYTYC